MAGRGSRLRPHTLTVPKPLIPIAGKPIVQRLVEDITKVAGEKIDEIAFIIGDFGAEVEASLIQIAESLGAKGTVYTQDEPLGTAHAIKCAEQSMQGNVVVAFADTLFKADFILDKNSDGVIWVKKVDDPSAFGVVKLDDYGFITDFVEKPKEFVSDLAIIGIYYFNSAEKLMEEINYIMDNDIKEGGEFQLTTALENLRQKGAKFSLGKVDDWMDCGNKNATVDTNGKVLEYERENVAQYPASAKIENCLIIPPCFIGENVEISNSKIGPRVSLGNNTKIINSNIDNSLIQENTTIDHGNLSNSMIGNSAEYFGVAREISLGDYSVLDFLSKDENTHLYTIGPKALIIGFSAANNLPIANIAKPYMAFLSEKYQSSISLSVIEGKNVFVVNHFSGHYSTTFYSLYNDPLNCDAYRPAVSHCLLAFNCDLDVSNSTLQIYYSNVSNSKFKDNFFSSTEELITYLKKVKNNGYAYESGEYHADEICYCCPILKNNKAIATISIYGQKSHLNRFHKQDIITNLLDISNTISDLLSNK